MVGRQRCPPKSTSGSGERGGGGGEEKQVGSRLRWPWVLRWVREPGLAVAFGPRGRIPGTPLAASTRRGPGRS